MPKKGSEKSEQSKLDTISKKLSVKTKELDDQYLELMRVVTKMHETAIEKNLDKKAFEELKTELKVSDIQNIYNTLKADINVIAHEIEQVQKLERSLGKLDKLNDKVVKDHRDKVMGKILIALSEIYSVITAIGRIKDHLKEGLEAIKKAKDDPRAALKAFTDMISQVRKGIEPVIKILAKVKTALKEIKEIVSQLRAKKTNALGPDASKASVTHAHKLDRSKSSVNTPDSPTSKQQSKQRRGSV